MKIAVVSLNTNDVKRLAGFYKSILGIDNGSDDDVHQVLISEGTQLVVYNDGSHKNNSNENISLAFTVEDIYAEYQKLQELGVDIVQKPTQQPWGAVNMRFYDPDRNMIYFRYYPE